MLGYDGIIVTILMGIFYYLKNVREKWLGMGSKFFYKSLGFGKHPGPPMAKVWPS